MSNGFVTDSSEGRTLPASARKRAAWAGSHHARAVPVDVTAGTSRSSAPGPYAAVGIQSPRSAVSAPAGAMRAVRAAVVVTAIVSVVITVALALIPQLRLTYPWQTEHLALETAASVIALLACFLVFGRLRRRT